MLLHCDLVYAAPTARFSLPFVQLGLVPEGGSSVLLPKLAGHARAAELLLLAEPFDPAVAREIGLVNEVVTDVDVTGRAAERANALALRPQAAVAEAKALLREPTRAALKDTIRHEARIFARRLTSPEAVEAFQAFLQKKRA